MLFERMEFKFDASQEYQLDAIAAAVGLFEGQPHMASRLVTSRGAWFQVIPNRLELSEDEIVANLQAIQTRQGLEPHAGLACIEATIETVAGSETMRFPNFSVEMET